MFEHVDLTRHINSSYVSLSECIDSYIDQNSINELML